MKKILFLMIIAAPAIFLALSGCDDSGEKIIYMPATYSYTVYAEHATAPDGVLVHAKLIAEGADCDTAPALYSGSGIMDMGEAEFEVAGIHEGTYTGCMFVDLDGNADPGNPVPDSGDAFAVSADSIEIPYMIMFVEIDSGDWSIKP